MTTKVTLFLGVSIVFNFLTSSYDEIQELDLFSLKKHVEVDTMPAFFENYAEQAQIYLDRFEGTPITGEILSKCARTTYDSTGIIVPLELALSQAQWESGMGLKGKSPKNNPYNVGEWDRGTMIRFKSTEEGVQAYFNLIAKDYLHGKSMDQLLLNFVNISGHRYASAEDYEVRVGKTCKTIKNWINEHSITKNI